MKDNEKTFITDHKPTIYQDNVNLKWYIEGDDENIFETEHQARKYLRELEDNKNALNIIEPKKHFIIVYDTVYKNTNLKAEELGLLLKLLSMAPTFKPTIEKMASILNIGQTKLKEIVKSLQKKGYLTIENNYKKGSIWTIRQEPLIKPEFMNYDFLSQNYTYDVELWRRLLKAKMITSKLYNELLDNLVKIAKTPIYNKNAE